MLTMQEKRAQKSPEGTGLFAFLKLVFI